MVPLRCDDASSCRVPPLEKTIPLAVPPDATSRVPPLIVVARPPRADDFGLAHANRLAYLETLELRVPEIERLVVAGAVMRGPERFGFGPGFEGGAAFPHSVGGIKRVILGFGAFEQVELDKARHLVEMAVARHKPAPVPDRLGCGHVQHGVGREQVAATVAMMGRRAWHPHDPVHRYQVIDLACISRRFLGSVRPAPPAIFHRSACGSSTKSLRL
jgi:hypothetical protein